jgi:hypothetical protein
MELRKQKLTRYSGHVEICGMPSFSNRASSFADVSHGQRSNVRVLAN